MDKVDSVYINGKKESECQIVSSSANEINVIIPERIYKDAEFFIIQFSKRVGGIYTVKSDRFEVNVSKCEIEAPKISKFNEDMLLRMKVNERLILRGENISDNSRLYVNGTETDAIFDYDNNIIEVDITPDIYEDNDNIELTIMEKLSETQTLCGNILEIEVVENSTYKEYNHTYKFAENNTFVMHAGGAWSGYPYTNCLEAFQYNYEKGCKAFEIDLMLTSDDVIVGRHDWTTVLFDETLVPEDKLLLEAYQRNNLPKTYDELYNMYEGRTPLTWKELLNYLLSDNELYIVTDTKYYNKQAVEYFFEKMVQEAREYGAEKVLDRVVVQIYNQDMYQKIMEIYPFKEIIYTLYMSPDTNEEILDFVDNSNVRIITLAKESFRDDNSFFQELVNRGCYIYAHTINDIDLAAQYLARGCTGIYTDFLTVNQRSELEDKVKKIGNELSENEKEITDEKSIVTNDELDFNRKYLLNYLKEINNKDYLLLMCTADEATRMIDDEIAAALESIGVSPDFRYAYRKSYIGIVSGGEKIYEAFSDDVIEYKYTDGENIFKLKSVGHNWAEVNSIVINGNEQVSEFNRGLQIVVFNKKLGVVEDNIVFDLYENISSTDYAPEF